jgi:hypothetical protein
MGAMAVWSSMLPTSVSSGCSDCDIICCDELHPSSGSTASSSLTAASEASLSQHTGARRAGHAAIDWQLFSEFCCDYRHEPVNNETPDCQECEHAIVEHLTAGYAPCEVHGDAMRKITDTVGLNY